MSGLWIYAALALVAVFALGVFVGCLTGRSDTRRYGVPKDFILMSDARSKAPPPAPVRLRAMPRA